MSALKLYTCIHIDQFQIESRSLLNISVGTIGCQKLSIYASVTPDQCIYHIEELVSIVNAYVMLVCVREVRFSSSMHSFCSTGANGENGKMACQFGNKIKLINLINKISLLKNQYFRDMYA